MLLAMPPYSTAFTVTLKTAFWPHFAHYLYDFPETCKIRKRVLAMAGKLPRMPLDPQVD